MAKRWVIHSAQGPLGPWTAAMIRDELRLGRIDPFDQAVKEGGAIFRPLVEVDEIFKSSRVERTANDAAAEATRISLDKAAGAETTGARAFAEVQAVIEPRQSAPTQASAPAKRQLEPKRHYYLIDPATRITGPYSSNEILARWFRRLVHPQSRIRRFNSDSEISVQRFIKFYQRVQQVGYHGQKTAPSMVMFMGPQNKAKSQLWDVIFAFVSLCILAAVAAIYFGYVEVPRFEKFRQRKHVEIQMKRPKDKLPDAEINEAVTQTPIFAPAEITRSQEVAVQAVLSETAPGQKVVRDVPAKPPSQKSQKAASKPTKKSNQKKPARKATTYSRREPYRSQTPVVSSPSSVGLNTVRATTVTTAIQTKAAAPKATWVDGQTVRLKGYRFNPQQLGACNGKCRIPLTGPQGTVTAIFFKDSFLPQFKRSTGLINASGIIKRGSDGWTLLLQSVS